MSTPGEEIAKRTKHLSRQEKVALYRAYKADPSGPEAAALWKKTTPGQVEGGLERIRNHRRARYVIWSGLLLATVGYDHFAHLVSQEAFGIAFFSVLVGWEAVAMFLSCPRCGFSFTSKMNQMFDRKCAVCGLSLDRVQD